MSSNRPPLPFGLGRDPACPPHRCNNPDTPLPAPGTPIHDQVASALSHLFQTFFATSLRYLGVSEILDWLEMNGTVDAWILTGLEQGRSPAEVGDKKNLEFGRAAIKSVVRGALEAEDEAWATSLRETGFSSALSMGYEGIVSQLTPSKYAPLPCLHTLLTQKGLALLKSAPLKSAFPVCPPRIAPSASPLLSSIRSLIQRGALEGPEWKVSSVWRRHVREAFMAYHSMLREIAEEIVTDPNFAQEYRIFLENISQPLQLLQLIAEDFEVEFGPEATRGLLAIGKTGGDNIMSIMDFCAAKRPSELLARVKQRVAEKQGREKRSKEIISLRGMIKDLDTQIRALLLDYRSGEIGPERTEELQKELEDKLDQRDALKKTVEDLQAVEDQEVRDQKREKMAREMRGGGKTDGERGGIEGDKASLTPLDENEEQEKKGFKLGSSKDLLMEEIPSDPFAATAPRAVSPLPGSRKGKAKALVQAGKPRGPSRYAPQYHPTQAPLRPYAPPASSQDNTPSSSRSSSPAPYRTTEQRISSRSRLPSSRLSVPQPSSPTPADQEGGSEEDYCEYCCPACAAEFAEFDAKATADAVAFVRSEQEKGKLSSVEAQQTAEIEQAIAHLVRGRQQATPSAEMSRETSSNVAEMECDRESRAADEPSTRKGKKKKKKKKKTANNVNFSIQQTNSNSKSPPSSSLSAGFSPLSRYPPPKCCPPDRCTGVTPNYAAWAELDGLLYETVLAGFKYEMIGALPAPLFHMREKLAKSYLLSGGRMCCDDGTPKQMDEFMRLAEERGVWSTTNHPEVQAWAQRVLAISLQKLVDVLRSTLGEICICKMSNHLDILHEARNRLEECERLDRTVPIDLPEMDQQQSFMKWAHIQIRAGKLSGKEWEGLDRQYKLADYLLAFSDAFDAATDRLVLRDGNPYIIADELITLLEWQGGVRAFDTAMRFGPHSIAHEFGSGVDLLDFTEDTPVDSRPLQSWGRLLELSKEARRQGMPFSRELAEQEKQRGNDFFAEGAYEKAIVSFSTSAIIYPTEPTFVCNAAAARMKLNTPAQYAEAISDCTLALFYQPATTTQSTSIKALYRRGTALAMLGHWKAAFADLKHLEKVAPDNEPAKEALKWANERYKALVQAKKIRP
ncbi:uncharacterized protein JCM6883_004682 [Sporobolomyces salmoneus]|uniref:uncharacterized protein n=1 Tax=Sporobolomyces salmoneus TaxID=183962 RepID=UPI00317AF753